MSVHSPIRRALAIVAAWLAMAVGRPVAGGTPPPVLDTIFPAGGQVGQTVEATVGGSHLEALRSLLCSAPGVECELLGTSTFRLTIPATTTPGVYEVWAVGDNGVSGPRTFLVGNRPEFLEVEPNDSPAEAMAVPVDAVINARIELPGDVDHFQFQARAGQRFVIECGAERVDSRLRAVLELSDAAGRRLAVNRGYFGTDPLINWCAPEDGEYVVKVQDLVAAGSVEHYYRLEIDTGPRVAFTVPAVVERGKQSRVALYGWNLVHPSAGQDPSAALAAASPPTFDRLEVDIPAALAEPTWPLPVRTAPAAVVCEGFAYHLLGSHAAVAVGTTDVPVVLESGDPQSPTTPQPIPIPCEVSGQLENEDERDWYAIEAVRGEVFYLAGFGQRIGSPLDLQISVFEATGERELATYGDEMMNLGSGPFPTNHLDPAGRWVAPANARYLLAVRSLGGGLPSDPRRVYRLSVRREEPAFGLVVVPHTDAPLALNVPRGGRERLEVLAFRQRGFNGAICVSARGQIAGVECPDVWLGPGVYRGVVVVSAHRHAESLVGELKLAGYAADVAGGTGQPARCGAVVRAGRPNGWGRLASRIPLAIVGEAPVCLTADAHEPLEHHLYGQLEVRPAPGGILDVAIQIDRSDAAHQAAVTLQGAGLPALIRNATAVIPAGQSRGHLSFYLPPTLPPGRYSLVVRAETTAATAEKRIETVVVHSNPVEFEVVPAAFLVELDPFAPRQARRGETVQVRYATRRLNGFIGKLHTELATPGRVTDVVGLRGRGETFVGGADTGSLQVIVNDDAPLGQQPFLRLFTVGVVEDQPVFFGGCFLALEVVE